MLKFLTGSGAPTYIPENIGDRYRDTSVTPAMDYLATAIRADGWKALDAESTSVIEDASVVPADFAENAVKRLSVFSIAFAALNTATTGVPVLLGTAIPDNAIIVKAFYEVSTTFVGNGDDSSTLSIGLEDQDNDMLAAIAISDVSNPFDAGLHNTIQDGSMANALKLSAARQLAVTWDAIATDTALTAGAMKIFVEWVQGV